MFTVWKALPSDNQMLLINDLAPKPLFYPFSARCRHRDQSGKSRRRRESRRPGRLPRSPEPFPRCTVT
ncbi:MAG: hypothetical protein K6T68_12745 [Alicyclobacillus shizuokensis]|nr:hypothetical protein [Alicyclobacillus shizuokensis]